MLLCPKLVIRYFNCAVASVIAIFLAYQQRLALLHIDGAINRPVDRMLTEPCVFRSEWRLASLTQEVLTAYEHASR